jgi:hypothetical protein
LEKSAAVVAEAVQEDIIAAADTTAEWATLDAAEAVAVLAADIPAEAEASAVAARAVNFK